MNERFIFAGRVALVFVGALLLATCVLAFGYAVLTHSRRVYAELGTSMSDDDTIERPASKLVLTATKPQLSVLGHPARNQLVFASRRFGKSTLGKLRVLYRCGKANPHGLYWWIAPTYKQCRTPFLQLAAAFQGAGLAVDVSRSELRMRLATGWRFECRSAEIAANLRGEGPDEVAVDEASRIPDETFYEAIRPAMTDKQAPLFTFSTPAGKRGWAYNLYRRGLDGVDPLYKGWKFTAYDAVFIPRAELEEARRTMPARAFNQEFMSEFLDEVGAVFEALRGRERRAPRGGEAVAIGVDWAKKVDWTWFVAVGSESGALFDCKRLPHGLSYPAQVEALASFVKRYVGVGYFVCHDRTGVGEAVDDLLARHVDASGSHPFDMSDGGNCEGVTFTEATKKQLVEEAVVDFESGALALVAGGEADPTYETLIREHEDYSLTIGKTGKVSYGAPEGLHDDAVCATLLTNRARRGMSRAGSGADVRISFA